MKSYALVLLLLVGCGSEPKRHIADLPPTTLSSEKLLFFPDAYDIEDKNPERRVHLFLGSRCVTVDGFEICSANDRLNTRLWLEAKHGDKTVKSAPVGGSVSDVLTRFVGAPPASAYQLIRFDRGLYAVSHRHGVTFFHEGQFCETIGTNPNGMPMFGKEHGGAPIVTSKEPYGATEVDRPVDGWRRYDLARHCPQ